MKRRAFIGSLIGLPAALKAAVVEKDPLVEFAEEFTLPALKETLPLEIVEHEKDGLKGLYFNLDNGKIARFHCDENGNTHMEQVNP
jgi:hypothetical protein